MRELSEGDAQGDSLLNLEDGVALTPVDSNFEFEPSICQDDNNDDDQEETAEDLEDDQAEINIEPSQIPTVSITQKPKHQKKFSIWSIFHSNKKLVKADLTDLYLLGKRFCNVVFVFDI